MTDDRDPIDVAIGLALRKRRRELDWTRPDLIAKLKVDISVNALANYESGVRPLTLRRLDDICSALQVSTSHLVIIALGEHATTRVLKWEIPKDDGTTQVDRWVCVSSYRDLP